MAVATRPPSAAAPPAAVGPASAPALPAAAGPVELSSGRGAVPLAALLFCLADVMAFFGLLAVWFAVRGVARHAGETWPPKGFSPGTYVPVVISVTVLMSACSAQWAAGAAARGDRRNALVALMLTIGFGLAIINAQSYAYTTLHFSVTKEAYATLYYALTGFHLLNVVVGVGLLAVAVTRTTAGHIGARDPGAARAAAHVWHVVNAMWLVAFLLIYVIP